jgi:hypothetical protein
MSTSAATPAVRKPTISNPGLRVLALVEAGPLDAGVVGVEDVVVEAASLISVIAMFVSGSWVTREKAPPPV